MKNQTLIPMARPSARTIVPMPVGQPHAPADSDIAPAPNPLMHVPYPPPGYAMQPIRPRTDGMAVASAVCGITGIIPIVCQIAGLTLGILSILRIRRSKIVGAPLRGTGWAIAGIVTSGVGLLGWIGMFAGLSMLSSSVGSSSDLLQTLLPK